MSDAVEDPGPLATPEEVQTFRSAQQEEYGTWIANQPILYNGVLAYNTGDPVPVSNVARHGYDAQGLVHKTNSKKAGELIQALHDAGRAEPVVVEPVSLGVPLPR
jgi:hypothetical protein